jgi:phage gp36-like protein
MPYATQADLQERYSEDDLLIIADRDMDNQLDADVITQALEDASAEIDGWIAARYTMPLPTVPDILVRLCADIAVYRLSVDAAQATDERRQRYEDAIKFLKALSKGDASLGMPKPPKTTSGRARLISNPRRFNRRNLGDLT